MGKKPTEKELLAKIASLERKNIKLSEEHNQLEQRLFLFEKILNKTNCYIYTRDLNSVQVSWHNNEGFINKIISGKVLNVVDIKGVDFLDFVHAEDRNLFDLRTIYLRENKGKKMSILFRAKHTAGNYKWYYLKISICKELGSVGMPKVVGIMTDFDENFFSKQQLNELNKEYLKEKYEKLLKKLTAKELLIGKYIAKGKSRKEIQIELGYKNISTVNSMIKMLFLKTGTSNNANLANLFSDFGLF